MREAPTEARLEFREAILRDLKIIKAQNVALKEEIETLRDAVVGGGADKPRAKADDDDEEDPKKEEDDDDI